ncbi:F169A protein, partial [Heliornis fulica]|nr:F169A protein [Heliornis fulica]
MSFPVDILSTYTHEDLESSGKNYMSDLRLQNPNHPEILSLPGHGKIAIRLSSVGFVPIYGEEQTHKVLALFAPKDSLTAVALYLADQWWSIDDIVRTSVSAKQGLHQVTSVGERIVLYVLNRIIYRTQEIGKNEIPFLCHGSKDYVKIMWKNGEAVGFYSVKPKGSVCSYYGSENYKLTVIDTMFVRKKHRGRDAGLVILEDFVNSFPEDALGLRYPLSSFIFTGKLFNLFFSCKQYLDKYPGDHNLLWEVEGAGLWFQRTSVMSLLHKENCRLAVKASEKANKTIQMQNVFQLSSSVSGASGQNTEVPIQQSVDTHSFIAVQIRSSNLKRPRIGKNRLEYLPEISQGNVENTPPVSESRLELSAHAPVNSEDSELPEVGTVEKDEETSGENKDQSVSEMELSVSHPEKQSEKEETPVEPPNGEVTEEIAKTSLTPEEEMENEVLSGEVKLQPETRGEELVTLLVPVALESSAKASEDTVSEVPNAKDSEMLSVESTLLEESTEEQQEPVKATTEKEVASVSKGEPSDNGVPNSVIAEAAEEPVSENVSPKMASSLEEQNEEAGHNSQEAPASLSQGSLIVVELEGVSLQQPSGQEGHKNQLEEPSEEPAEQMDHADLQTAAERAADSSSEETEIEVPIVDRRNLRRKAKGHKGPPKKKGK